MPSGASTKGRGRLAQLPPPDRVLADAHRVRGPRTAVEPVGIWAPEAPGGGKGRTGAPESAGLDRGAVGSTQADCSEDRTGYPVLASTDRACHCSRRGSPAGSPGFDPVSAPAGWVRGPE